MLPHARLGHVQEMMGTLDAIVYVCVCVCVRPFIMDATNEHLAHMLMSGEKRHMKIDWLVHLAMYMLQNNKASPSDGYLIIWK